MRTQIALKRRLKAFSFGVYSSLAQSVEHAAVNRRVVGSSPTGGAENREIFNLYVALFWRHYIRDRVEYLSYVIILRRFTLAMRILEYISSELY